MVESQLFNVWCEKVGSRFKIIDVSPVTLPLRNSSINMGKNKFVILTKNQYKKNSFIDVAA